MIGARQTLLALSILITLPAQAQLKQNDFTLRENQLSEMRFSVQKIDLHANTSISGKRYITAQLPKPKSVIQEKKSPVVLAELRSKKMFGKKTNIHPVRRFKIIKPRNRPGIIEKKNRVIRPVQSGKFAKDPLAILKSRSRPRKSKQVALSLQDINRYVFRREHSSKPGLPVHRAGSGKSVGAVKRGQL